MALSLSSMEQPRQRSRAPRSSRNPGRREPAALDIAIAAASALAIVLAQYFHGGALRPALAFPAYGAILLAGSLCAVKALSSPRRSSASGRAEGAGGGLPLPLPLVLATALLLWLGWHGLNARDAGAGSASWRQALACMLIFTVLARGISSPRARLVFFGLLFAGALAQILLSLEQYRGALGISPQGWFSEQLRTWFEGRSTARITGFYLNSNHFVWFLNAAGLYALAFAFWGRFSPWLRLLVGGAAAAFLLGAVFTLSRGGLLALIAGYAIFLLLSACTLLKGRSHPRRALRLLGLLFCCLPLAFHEPLLHASGADFSRFESLFEDSYRTGLWPIARQYVEEAPLVGNGPGSFVYYARQHRDESHTGDDLYAHNDWLQITGDYGAVGLGLALLSLFGIVAGGLWRLVAVRRAMEESATLQSNRAAVMIGSLAAVAAFVVHSFFDFNLQLPANALLAAACLGCLSTPSRSRPGGRKRPWPLATGCLLLCWALAFSLHRHRNEIAWLRGENAALKGDYVAACRIAKEALPDGYSGNGADDAPNARLWYLLGDITLQRVRLQRTPEGMLVRLVEAEAALKKAAALLPQERLHHLRLAEVLLYRHRPVEGRAAALRGIALAPRQALGYELCGWSYEQEDDIRHALFCYEQASLLPDQKIARKRFAYLQSRGK